MTKILYSNVLLCVLFVSTLNAEKVEDALKGFDDSAIEIVEQNSTAIMDGFDETEETQQQERKTAIIEGLTGKLTQQVTYSYLGVEPHDEFTSLKSSLLLDYEHKFENGWRLKTNAKAYYDAIYDIRNDTYSQNEIDEQKHEIELFDAYVEGSITDSLDVKVGRQVVVWGRSDTIRITDVLNPLDNRRPGMIDIEDLRLPVGMVKMDYFLGDWRITPIAIFEQRTSKNPAFGSAFNLGVNPHISEIDNKDVTYALSIGGEFSGWDVNVYAAHMYDDAGYVNTSSSVPKLVRDKITMMGTAFNVLHGAWLFKSELAYFDGLKYITAQDKSFTRVDALLGFEYKGINETTISYDISLRHINDYDTALMNERTPLEENTYQHAFRVSSDFLNATLHANYLISLYGEKLDQGGFQRAWIKYDIADAIAVNIGLVDYIGGSKLFDSIKDNDMVFTDISYSF